MASSPLQPAWISISWRVKESHKPPAGGEQAAGLVPPRSGISSYALRHPHWRSPHILITTVIKYIS